MYLDDIWVIEFFQNCDLLTDPTQIAPTHLQHIEYLYRSLSLRAFIQTLAYLAMRGLSDDLSIAIEFPKLLPLPLHHLFDPHGDHLAARNFTIPTQRTVKQATTVLINVMATSAGAHFYICL